MIPLVQKTNIILRKKCLHDWLDQLHKPRYVQVIGKNRNTKVSSRN